MESLLPQKTITNKPTVSDLGFESKNSMMPKDKTETVEVDPCPDWKSQMEEFFRQQGEKYTHFKDFEHYLSERNFFDNIMARVYIHMLNLGKFQKQELEDAQIELFGIIEKVEKFIYLFN